MEKADIDVSLFLIERAVEPCLMTDFSRKLTNFLQKLGDFLRKLTNF